ncbi:bifunctional diguanylate cyclase/phosphodiesterase [Paracandidimonas soli]|uniref:bifunctional diguanylate cyclase/phosphodiesterase n=1 Tax=Paracandidimonas soli TaxID=1917182 RepID=UPI003DA79FE0
MSLLKQLLLSVTIAIAAILTGVLAFSIDAARTYLDGQLQSESDNTASALALLLSQPANQDDTTRELLMMAVYDSGQFSQIRLRGPDGKLLFERSRSVEPADAGTAPAWFSRWLPLEQPLAERQVSDGWRQVGVVSVSVDNSYARDALWKSSVRMLVLVLAAGAVWALFVILLVRWLKRALREEIAAQVRSIGDSNALMSGAGASPGPAKSRVAELTQVVQAIADTRERVRATAQEQTARIESLQLELHLDPVTGMANRKYFVNELRRTLQSSADAQESGQSHSGRVLIFRQRDLAAINASLSRAAVDEWLRSVCERISQVIEDEPEPRPQVARLNGSDFVVFMPGYSGPQATRLAQRIRQVLLPARVLTSSGHLCRWAFALTDFTPQCDVSSVLSRLDHGLMAAESAGHGDVEYVALDADRRAGATESEWRTLLDNALRHGDLGLAIEPDGYRGEDGEVDAQRYQASLVLHDCGQEMSGYLFMPAAARLGLSADCDLRAIELGLEWLGQNEDSELVVKVSLPSLIQPQFLPEMQRHLQGLMAHPTQTQRLLLEIDAHGLVAYEGDVWTFCRMAAEAGVRVGLRRLAQQPAAIMRLHRVPLEYVKLGGDFIESLLTSPGCQQMLSAIAATAGGLGIRVYADGAQDEEVVALLLKQGVLVR